MKFTGLFYSLACLVLVACSGGGGGSSSNSPEAVVSKKSIEALMGAYLQNPVNQCGSGLSDKEKITEAVANASVVNYESGPVRPLAISADNKRLFVTNTPANCLEIYEITDGDTLTLVSTVSVGVDPVAVAVRNENEVWVINHVSDSVSVVRLDGTPRVLRTLQVGDEPRDIVFAGPRKNRAFITAASRGQNKPGFTSEVLTQPGKGRADVWVFDASDLDDSLNGKPLAVLTLNSDIPRALAVNADGSKVYAAAFHSGNGTTTLHRDVVNKRDLNTNSSTFNTLLSEFNLKPLSPASADSKAAPETSLIVRKNSTGIWVDENGQDLSRKVKFDFADDDVFVIDAAAATPAVTDTKYAGVGTTLFNMVFSNGKLFVSNTESLNEVRFEGSGAKSKGTVKGHMIDSRITVIDTSSNSVTPVNLNSHLSFPTDNGMVSADKKAKTMSQPTAMVISPDESVVYVAGFGSGKIAALPVSALNNSFQPDVNKQIAVPAGPAGLALKTDGSRLYVYSRIDHKLSIIKTIEKTKVYELAMFTPESASVIAGRRLMYDADNASGNGSVACGSCHVFSDLDHLAWDLGNPDESTVANTNQFVQTTLDAQSNLEKNTNMYVQYFSYLLGSNANTILSGLSNQEKLEKLLPASLVPIKAKFHPVKGPMTTQTLKGMRGNGPMHWRGDRMGLNKKSGETLEEASFKDFNDSFVSLLGRNQPLDETDLQHLTDFSMKLSLPPNPIRALDNSLTAQEQAGKDIYFNKADVTELGSCNNCHTLDAAKGQFGTAGLMTYEGPRFSDNFKVPHLRNVYQKVGMFGYSLEGSNQEGKQYRGFGLGNDGSVDTLVTFFSDPVFVFKNPDTDRKNMAAFMLAFDSDYLPITGQQLTWRPGSSSAINDRLALLKKQAKVTSPRPACDLQVSGSINGVDISGLYQADGTWKFKDGTSSSDAALIAMATANQPLTFTCLPPGTGVRTALKLTQ